MLRRKLLQKTDHFTIIVILKGLKKTETLPKVEKTVDWNLNKPGGWKTYKEVSEAPLKDDFVEEKNVESINDVLKKFEKVHTKIKYTSFGKHTIKHSIFNNEMVDLYRKKASTDNAEERAAVDEEIGKCIMNVRANAIEKQVNLVKSSSTSRPSTAFMMRKLICGSKKQQLPPEAIEDVETGEIIVDKDEIKKATLTYCTNVLQKNQVNEDNFLVELQKIQVNQRMEVTEEDFEEVDFCREEFDKQVKLFKDKGKKTYEFIVNAGEGLKNLVFKISKLIWETEDIPDSWNLTNLFQIFKKGPKNKLNSYRYIHLKNWFPRLFEGIVFQRAKPVLIKNISKFQIGAVPGHMPQEHLFVLKSLMALYKKLGIPIVINCWDILKFFDRQNLIDALSSAYTAGVKGKVFRLLYKLNRNTKIQVKTPVGITEVAEAGPSTGHGSIPAAILSAHNLDCGVSKHFESSRHQICYGKMKVKPLLFQDDCLTMATTREGAQDNCNRFEQVMNNKLLEINLDKSVFVILGRKDVKSKIQKEINNLPLSFKGNMLQQKKNDKWLGDLIDTEGENSSVISTINERKLRIMTSIIEITSIIEETRINRIGGLQCGLDLWEVAVVPSLLNNSNSWTSLSKEVFNQCESIQLNFLRSLLSVPKSTPKPALLHQSNTMLMKTRISKNILNFMKHIVSLPESALAKQVFQEQLENNWPGLVDEAKEAAKLLQVSFNDVLNEDISKDSFKRMVKKKAKIYNASALKEQMSSYKKLNQIINENPEEVKYFMTEPVFSARQIFRHKCEMFEAKMNFKQKYKNNYKCDSCQSEVDENTHVLHCESYKDLRVGMDLQSDTNLGQYLQKVLLIRTRLKLTR